MMKSWLCVLTVLAVGSTLHAEDWPEHRGKGRLGVWNETGIVDTLPEGGLKIRWRTPVKKGYSGPVVANGRVFLMDFEPLKEGGLKGTERALALDEKTGRILWTREWDIDYSGIAWPNGPRSTPTVDGNRVYFQGAAGHLLALSVSSGEALWTTNYVQDHGSDVGFYGFAASPIVDGDRLICLAGGEPDAKLMAFDKMTGKELWRALPNTEEMGVSAPILVDYGGARQLLLWHPEALVSLNPVTGKVLWQLPFRAQDAMNPATPSLSADGHVLVSTFYTGSMMAKLDPRKPGATMVWKSKSDSEIETDTIHSVIGTPVIVGDYAYGTCSYGQLRCIRVSTGERVWESMELTQDYARWSNALLVRHGDRFFANTDRGDLVILKLSPAGYEEISRTFLIKPTTPPGNRRKMTFVNWSQPAFANRNIYARNDEEIISATLAADEQN